MIHGKVPDKFEKLVKGEVNGEKFEPAPQLPGEVFLQLANLMGPANDNNPNSDISAGWTYFGQFVDHDLTFDQDDGMNTRTPIFDLDSLYGQGPISSNPNSEHDKFFEGASGKETFKIGSKADPVERTKANLEGDLNRNANFVAEIPDPRNDENIIIASLQLLFQKFHNLLINNEGLSFPQAKQAVTWHYQSVVKSEFLPLIVGKTNLDNIEQIGRKIFTVNQLDDVFMPTEYSGACYRFGHSMVREMYSFNDTFNNTLSFPNLFFKFPGRPKEGHKITDIWTLQGSDHRGQPQSLMRFFDPTILNSVHDADNLSGRIDTKLAKILYSLEVQPGENNVLAHRNLLAGVRLQLANGQDVARFLQLKGAQVTPLTEAEILSNGEPNEIRQNTPLWYYVLKEAEIQHNGKHLGDVGGTIVAETIIGLLESDPNSFVNRQIVWPFKLGDVASDRVLMTDIIRFVDAG